MLTEELDHTGTMLANQYAHGDDGECNMHHNPIYAGAVPAVSCTPMRWVTAYESYSNPLFDLKNDSSDTAAVMQVETRSKARNRAPSGMERLRRNAKDAKVRSECSLTEGPVIDSATDTDVIGASDSKHAVNVLEHEPLQHYMW